MFNKLKRIVKRMIFIFALFFTLGHLFVFYMNNESYLIGRDTVQSFGNGRYQIIQLPLDTEFKKRNVLFDLKENTTIESEIYVFYHDKKDSVVYIIGINGYTILKYKEEKYKQSKSLQGFTKEEQSIFISYGYYEAR